MASASVPGGLRPFHAQPISGLNDRVVPADRLFGPAASQAQAAVMADGADDDAMIAAASGLLRERGPAPDPVVDQVAGLVGRITEDPALRRVAQLAEVSGLPERKLQRLFSDYVGVSPKWVMRRARLHEAALRVEADGAGSVDWAALAADLGYADQAHLSRDFTTTLGVPPSRYTEPGYGIRLNRITTDAISEWESSRAKSPSSRRRARSGPQPRHPPGPGGRGHHRGGHLPADR